MQIFQLPVLLLRFVVYIQKLKNISLTSYRLIVSQLKEASLPLSYLYFWPTSTSKLLWKQARICPARSQSGLQLEVDTWKHHCGSQRDTPASGPFFFYQVSSLREERCQEPVTDRHNFLPPPSLSNFTDSHSHCVHCRSVSVASPQEALVTVSHSQQQRAECLCEQRHGWEGTRDISRMYFKHIQPDYCLCEPLQRWEKRVH